MDIAHSGRAHAHPVDLRPATVGIEQPQTVGQIACPLRRDEIEHVAFDPVAQFGRHGAGASVEFGHQRVGAVIDHSLVGPIPGRQKQRLFRDEIGVAIEDDDPGAGLGCLEIAGNLADTLIGPGRAAVRRLGNAHDESAAIGHGLELSTQRHGLRTGLPGMQNRVLCLAVEAGDLVEKKIDTR